METKEFGNGFKTVAVLLQVVCLMIVIVTFSLILNLFERSRLSFRDIGNNYSFFHSYFYMERVTEEVKDLAVYLQIKKTIPVWEPDNVRYKHLKLKFNTEETNFYYWFLQDGAILTNMPQAEDMEEAMSFAKEMGSYLYYDDSDISIKGNLAHMTEISDLEFLKLFQKGRGGGLMIAVDTSLSHKDTLSKEASVYETYFPWIRIAIFAAVLAFICFLLCMIYLTLAAGRSGSDEEIRLHRIDYLPTEILFAVMIIFMTGLITFCARLSEKDWGMSSSLILTGTLVFLSDAALLALYLSFVRKIKADIFTKCSLAAHIVHTIKASMKKQGIANRAKIQFAIYTVVLMILFWEAMIYRHIWAAVGLMFLFAYTAVHFLQLAAQRKKILEGIREIGRGRLDYKFNIKEFNGDYTELAEEINGIGDGLMQSVEENVKNERLKTELVTNVSHDIKTPLTSIINYISLIKMEGAWNENVENYVGILEKKSARLKQLTEDLVEVSQITSGNICLDMQPINMVELICQTGGEFNEIFEECGLTVITRLPQEAVMVLADGSRVWRVVQNLYNNVAQYAMKDTRVFVELKVNEGYAEFSIKDISAQGIHKSAQDLGERFVRGDESRGTEGHGLGLSIARNLTNLMGGTFEIKLDGDLFIVSLAFPVILP